MILLYCTWSVTPATFAGCSGNVHTQELHVGMYSVQYILSYHIPGTKYYL